MGTRRTGTSSLESSLLRTRSWRRARSSTTSSWIPGPPPTPWSGSTSLSEACSQPPGTSPARTFWFNGEEKATVNFDTSSKTASHTMHLPSGKDLTIDLAWPKMTADASDLEFGVTIAPDRKVVSKFGWEWAGVKKVYLDVVGNNPWMGDYKLSR